MSTKSRQVIVIYGGAVMGAKIRAEGARKRATEAAREADRAEAEAWSIQMEAFGGPAQYSPTIAQCLNGGYGWVEMNAIAVRPAPASRLMPSAGRALRRSGSWKDRSGAGPAGHLAT